jgi:ribosomal protein L18E
VIGTGELSKKLNFTGINFSKSAKATADKAGCTIK